MAIPHVLNGTFHSAEELCDNLRIRFDQPPSIYQIAATAAAPPSLWSMPCNAIKAA